MPSLHSSHQNGLPPLLERAPCSDSQAHLLGGAEALSLKGARVSCTLCVSDALRGVQLQAKKTTRKSRAIPRPASPSMTRAGSGIAWALAVLAGEGVANPVAACADPDSGVGQCCEMAGD